MRTVGTMNVSWTLGLAGLVIAGAMAAQNPPAAAPNAPPMRAAPAVGGGAARYLAENPSVLHLTPVQVERIRKLSAKVDSLNAPVRAQLQPLTGGRPFRELPPAERRRIAPQLQQATQRLRANNEMALDSVEAVLTPEQTTQLESLRQDFKERLQARRAQGWTPRRRP
jgi:hypothetical protein